MRFRTALVALSVLFAGPPATAAEPGCPGGPSPDPAVLFCEDYEDPSPVSSRWVEHNQAGGSFVRVAGEGVGGGHAMRVTYKSGQVGAGWMTRTFGTTPPGFYPPQSHAGRQFREIYWREYIRTGPGWSGNPYKLSSIYVFASGSWAQAALAHLWPGGKSHLVLDPVSGIGNDGKLATTQYNDFANLRWLGGNNAIDAGWTGSTQGSTSIFGPQSVDRWFCIEARAKLNTPGQSDGEFEFWVDGQAQARLQGLNWVETWGDYGFNAITLENYWNGGSPQQNVRYRDHLVVSEKRIGCLGSGGGPTSPPQQPSIIIR